MKEVNEPSEPELFSLRVKAGKRTYFFDVKSTRGEDFFLTITESKKKQDGFGVSYEKHKIFLYKEDFNKFVDGLQLAIADIKTRMPNFDFDVRDADRPSEGLSNL